MRETHRYIAAIWGFGGLEARTLRPMVDIVSVIMMLCASIWMVAIAVLVFFIELDPTAPYYVALGLAFLSLFAVKPQMDDHTVGTALCVLLFILAILASFTLPLLGAGVVTTAIAASLSLLFRGARFALAGVLATTLIRLGLHRILDVGDAQADQHSALMAMAASVMLSIGLYVLVRLVVAYQDQLTEASRRLAQLSSDRTAMFDLLAQDIAPPIAAIRVEISGGENSQTSYRRLHQNANQLMQVIDGLDAALSIRELPPIKLQDCDLPGLLSEVRAQGERLLKPRGIRVVLEKTELPVHHYRVDIARLRAIMVSAAQTMYLMDDQFSELRMTATGRRVSDSAHRITLTLSVDQIKYSIAELQRTMMEGHTAREADEFTVTAFFDDIRTLAQELSASIDLYAPDNGQAVTLSLTLMLEPGALPDTTSNTESPALGLSLEGQRVLLVDDDAVQRRVISKLISDHYRADVVVASSAGEAIKYLTKERDFGLIITDQYMPGMKGSEFIKYLRDMEFAIPVIGMTAAAQRSELVNLYEAGAAAALVKPVTPDSLRGALAKIPQHYG